MCDDDLIDLRCLLRGCRRAPRAQPRAQPKILYVGNNFALLPALRAELRETDCSLDPCPNGSLGRAFLKSQIPYALLLLDDVLDASAAELAAYTRTLKHRAQTPCLVFKPADSVGALAETIRSLLAKLPNPP